jgi:hypothetical protein
MRPSTDNEPISQDPRKLELALIFAADILRLRHHVVILEQPLKTASLHALRFFPRQYSVAAR